MLLHIIHLYRAESPKPYMQCDMGNIDAHLPYLLKQLLRKMKACGRRCGTPFLLRVNGLVSVFILQLVGDIRGRGISPSLSRISSKIPS